MDTMESTYCDGCKKFSRGPVCPYCQLAEAAQDELGVEVNLSWLWNLLWIPVAIVAGLICIIPGVARLIGWWSQRRAARADL